MLGDELEHLPVLRLERPVPKLLNISTFDLIDCQHLLVVFLMGL
jgi:hypothetical protein